MKKFYNNTLIGGAFSKALRVIALLCVLLGVSSSAWGLNYSEYYVVGPAVGGWDKWVKMTHENDDKYTCPAQGNSEFKISNYQGYDNFPWNNIAAGNGVSKDGGNNAKLEGGKNQIIFYANGNGGNGWLEGGTTSGPSSDTYCISVWESSDSKEYARATFEATDTANKLKATFTISNYTGNTSDYQFWVGKNNAWEDGGKSANVKLSDYIKSCSSGTMSICIYSNSSQTNYGPQEGECIGGSGDDDDDDEDADFSCETIEIWCKGKGSYIDMACYAFDPDNQNNKPFGNWYGETRHDIGSYNGADYAVWRVNGFDKLTVIFNDKGSTQTADLLGLVKGHRYIFELSDSWHMSSPSPRVIDCSGEDIGEQTAGTIFMDLSSFSSGNDDWTKEGALFKAVVTTEAGATITYDFVQCSTDAKIYFIDEVLNLNDIKKVNIQRINPNDLSHIWNSTGDITFKVATPCIKITGWNNSYSLTTYTGECGVTSSSVVYLGKDAYLTDDKSSVTLYGYLGYTNCANITEWGFLYTQCTTGSTVGCTPTKNAAQLKVTTGGQLQRGEAFELTTSGLPAGYTYGYKAYIKIEDFIYVSSETGYFTLADCTERPVKGSPITYTVDASLGKGHMDECSLTYGDLETAIKALKDSYLDENPDYHYVTKNGDSYNLNQDVTINVHFYDDTESTSTAYTYQGTEKVASAGTDKIDGGKGLALLIQNFNRDANAEKTLTIKAANAMQKPWIHHPIIRNSRNIVLDGLFLISDPTNKVKDNAFEIDINSQKWDAIKIGELENANITVQNCNIGSAGFTGVHISGIDGVTFLDNEFEAVFTSGTTNDINYGASAKFIACENIKFMRNDFRGDHATLVWMQECQNVLFMNNVFWNTNQWLATSQTPAAIRLVAQFGKDLQNLGFYYNTFYFANTDHDSDKEANSGYDFLAFSNTVNNSGGSSSDFISGKIDFMYNNCYSYDEDAPGKSSNPLLSRNAADFNFCPNNFWSEYDQNIYDNLSQAEQDKYVSKFDFTGCDVKNFINVKNNVCATTATGPASLVVSGQGLNIGSRPDVSKTGFTLTEDEMRRDRTRVNARPENGSADKWTVGAYQNTSSVDTKVIIWQGAASDKWDDRNNWIDAETGRRITCVNVFSKDLKVIIPQANSETYPTPAQGVTYWPEIPKNFADTNGRETFSGGVPASEQVSAGLGLYENGAAVKPTMYAKTIELEYGAGLKGVENLVNGSEHYSSAIMGFTAPRSQWILVGTVVMPFDDKGNPRNVKSGDYFIKNQTPHVYMHQAKINGASARWDETFTSLEEWVYPTTVFAIQIPDQYGKYKLPAQYYNSMSGTNFDPKEPQQYSFEGKFVNDKQMPLYNVTAGTPVLLNNSYPCNIDAKKLEEISGGNVQYYDYTSGTFMNTDATTSQVLLKPQHGFIFTPAAGKNSLEVTSAMLTGGDTKSRSSEVTLPTLSLNLFNANTGVGYSNVVVKIDEMLAEGELSASNVEKVFAPNVESPELYIIANDAMYSRYIVNSNTKVIPLGVRLKKDMNIKFKKEYFNNYERAILVDKFNDKEIDLLHNSYTTETLVAGDIEGRFFLNLTVASDVELPNDDEEGDDDVTTEVEEDIAEKAINIFVDESKNIRVVTDGVELQTIYVSDMAGKTMKYNVKGYAATLNLPVAQGVYTLKVIGDKANRTEKVILK